MLVRGVTLWPSFIGVSHRKRVRMAGHGNNILGLKDRRLFQNAPANFSQREAMLHCVIPAERFPPAAPVET